MSKITRIDVTPRYVDPIYGRFTKRAALINESMPATSGHGTEAAVRRNANAPS
jgi:hypothetical protein